MLEKNASYLIFSNSDWTKFGVSDGKYKYIYSLDGACNPENQTEELYDLSKDQKELVNIAKKDEKLVNIYKKILFNYLSSYNLPLQTSSKKEAGDETKSSEDKKIMENIKSLQY